MTSLRMRVVEAGARAFVEEAKKNPVDHRTALGSTSWLFGQSVEEVTEAVLDAMLDCLAENWREWHDEAWNFPALSTELRLLTVLREDR